MPQPIHVHPTAPLAPRVLLPGDPGRALRLAQHLLHEPRMFNHNRGLWGYTGTAADGQPLTIQSTGMGAPSAAIVISELADLGAERLMRVGTCGGLAEDLELGQLLVAEEAMATDGASRALGAPARVTADEDLLARLVCATAEFGHGQDGDVASRVGTVVSSDLFYDPSAPEADWRREGAAAVEMESAVLFTLAARRGLQAASVLAVSDLLLPARERIEPERLIEAEHRLGDVAAAALATGP